MLGAALDYPTRGAGSRALLVASGWLFVLAVLVLAGGVYPPVLLFCLLPLVLVRGYYYRVLARAAGGDTAPPAFGGFSGPLVAGLRSVAVLVGYLVPAVVLVGGAVASGAVTGPPVDPTVSPALGPPSPRDALGGLALLFGLLWLVFAWVALPAAAARAADHDRLGAAFSVGVLGVVATEDYAVGWVASVLLQAATLVLGAALTPVLVGPLVFVFGNVATRYVYGRSYAAAVG
jgi:hypothetical protein